MRFINKDNIIKQIYEFFFSYPAPSNLSYMWNFGVYSLICLVIQIITGLFLSMHYVPDINLAFFSVEHIMRDVQYGWLMRYIHANGASMFFIVMYIHTFRGLYYNSYVYPRQKLWILGVIIMSSMIITAFIGYVLPWGQMSFWGATVTTNLVSAIPLFGSDIVIWLWGGYSVDSPTLNRFYSFHFFLPFLMLGLIYLHLVSLHETGSNNPLGIDFKHVDHVNMYPFYIYKDILGIFGFLVVYSLFLYFTPNVLGHTDNYILANPLVTPTHIVPEWYFLPFYAILRSIPNKLVGVLAMVFSILILALLPFYIRADVRTLAFRPVTKLGFWFFLLVCITLGWVGSKPAEYPYVLIGQISTFLYFLYLMLLLPLSIRADFFYYRGEDRIIWKVAMTKEELRAAHKQLRNSKEWVIVNEKREPLLISEDGDVIGIKGQKGKPDIIFEKKTTEVEDKKVIEKSKQK